MIKVNSFSSTVPLLRSYKNIYWILGGLAKKGDKLNLKKFFLNIKAYIYGKDKNFLLIHYQIKFFTKFINTRQSD